VTSYSDPEGPRPSATIEALAIEHGIPAPSVADAEDADAAPDALDARDARTLAVEAACAELLKLVKAEDAQGGPRVITGQVLVATDNIVRAAFHGNGHAETTSLVGGAPGQMVPLQGPEHFFLKSAAMGGDLWFEAASFGEHRHIPIGPHFGNPTEAAPRPPSPPFPAAAKSADKSQATFARDLAYAALRSLAVNGETADERRRALEHLLTLAPKAESPPPAEAAAPASPPYIPGFRHLEPEAGIGRRCPVVPLGGVWQPSPGESFGG